MPRYRDEPPAVRVYTVCDESRYLIVRNVPALGCGDELLKIFSAYGEVEECKPMDAEDCEPYTDVYWIKFCQVNNARFAKRKLDEYVFLGSRLQVSYAPQYESLSETMEKLDLRRKEVFARLNSGRSRGAATKYQEAFHGPPSVSKSHLSCSFHTSENPACGEIETSTTHVSSDKENFLSQSMNQTVEQVREKLNKIRSSAEVLDAAGSSKRIRSDNRRRI
ncbi:hypothetical protein M9H77_14154 [Catharanthus roseus]|uniref:Uncharacterized protein n=1 Tax=Catharanthus roseus TaxID=4058 RepID=A0ACC0BM94_CATRO|nr:hypothetical protein M9H77_14154 [Catharanthus roseus]